LGGSNFIREINPFLFRPLGLVLETFESGTLRLPSVCATARIGTAWLVEEEEGEAIFDAAAYELEVTGSPAPGLAGDRPAPDPDAREELDEAFEEEDILRAFFHSFLVPFFTRWWISGGSSVLS
jgi:hypothetical protein